MSLTALRLPDTLNHKIDRVAKQIQRSKSYVIRQAVEEYLNDVNDYETALGRLHDKNDKIISSKEMRKLVER